MRKKAMTPRIPELNAKYIKLMLFVILVDNVASSGLIDGFFFANIQRKSFINIIVMYHC